MLADHAPSITDPDVAVGERTLVVGVLRGFVLLSCARGADCNGRHASSGRRTELAVTLSAATAVNCHTSKLSSPLNRTGPSSGVSLTAPGAERGMLKNGW